MNDSDLELARAHLQVLRDRFATSLRERLDQLDGLVRAAREGSADALAEALVAAHRLSGTAGSYGHQAAGEAAAALEGALRRIADGSAHLHGGPHGGPDPDAWEAALAALAHARAATPGAGLR